MANRFYEKAESSDCSSLEPRGRIAGKVTQGVYGLWRQVRAPYTTPHAGRDQTISPAAQTPRDDRRDTTLDKRNDLLFLCRNSNLSSSTTLELITE